MQSKNHDSYKIPALTFEGAVNAHLLKLGNPAIDLAAHFGVSDTLIAKILSGELHIGSKDEALRRWFHA
jgi:hypothetical protein